MNDFRSPEGFIKFKRSISMHVQEHYNQALEHSAIWLFECFPKACIDATRHECDIAPELVDGELEEPIAPAEKSWHGAGLLHWAMI